MIGGERGKNILPELRNYAVPTLLDISHFLFFQSLQNDQGFHNNDIETNLLQRNL